MFIFFTTLYTVQCFSMTFFYFLLEIVGTIMCIYLFIGTIFISVPHLITEKYLIEMMIVSDMPHDNCMI